VENWARWTTDSLGGGGECYGMSRLLLLFSFCSQAFVQGSHTPDSGHSAPVGWRISFHSQEDAVRSLGLLLVFCFFM